MPNVYIGETAFNALSDEYGYSEAKEKIRELTQEHAKEVQGDD